MYNTAHYICTVYSSTDGVKGHADWADTPSASLTELKSCLREGLSSCQVHSAVATTMREVEGGREIREEVSVDWKVSVVTSHQVSMRGR